MSQLPEKAESAAYDPISVSASRNRVIVVTGAASGIGRATTLLAIERGDRVAAIDIDEAGLAETAGQAGSRDAVFTRAVDVTDGNAVAKAVQAVINRWGRLDAVVAAAALGTTGRIEELDVALWDRIVDITLKGSSNCCRSAIPHLRAGGGGAIVLFGSVLGHAMTPGVGAYAAAKAGIEGLVRTLAIDHAADGIRINCIVPGSTDTPMMWLGVETDQLDEARRMCEEDIPLGRIAEPGEIARPTLFLCSDEASFITGATLVADGGVLAKLASRL
jgi:NAD(P)-dependent dehydrogenase (short-subunit alcohol dehydrogenase family)